MDPDIDTEEGPGPVPTRSPTGIWAPESPASFTRDERVAYDEHGRPVHHTVALRRRKLYNTSSGVYLYTQILISLIAITAGIALILLDVMGVTEQPGDTSSAYALVFAVLGWWLNAGSSAAMAAGSAHSRVEEEQQETTPTLRTPGSITTEV